MPENVEWPAWKQYNQSFIAQINLADLPSPSPLPASGLLSFFVLSNSNLTVLFVKCNVDKNGSSGNGDNQPIGIGEKCSPYSL
ncbi:DUF1963 domain-containing protein [Brevibacillus massiliensis]|uniref:DUF1963 domain-containing protein n=1 Tax=Brevibacillus massiliensis TaxID=1118054 RepID=UPI001FE09577|nr:DUF1963 domain-containing protein [Brevibacillus massiliensis]